MTKDPYQWNDGEVVFCAGLVALGGVPAVPHASIPAYLDLQIANANNQGETEVVKELQLLLDAYHFASLIDGAMVLMRAEHGKEEVN